MSNIQEYRKPSYLVSLGVVCAADKLNSITKMEISAETIWISVGLFGQLLFSLRFIIQWIASEKQKKSVIPEMFWFFSIGGGMVLLSYAIWRMDPVFILGQACGVFIYSRNLYFIYRKKEGE